MAKLPRNLSWDQSNQKWAQQLDPVIANVFMNGQVAIGVDLVEGDNTFNHLLSRQMQGWTVTDLDAASLIYRSKPLNPSTLTLNSSAPCTINLWVF